MIKTIHRYKQSIGVIFLFIAFCFAISGVGLDVLHSGSSPYRDAITVNDEKFSANDVARSAQNIESRYRQMLGDNFQALANTLNLNIRQQAIDSLIDQSLLDQEASKQGFTASQDSIRSYILSNIFKGSNGESTYSQEAYKNLLQNIGMSPKEFEGKIQQEIARTTLVNLLRDAVVSSPKDGEALLKKQKTTYSVTAATITASDVAASLPAPSEETLKKFYEEHATEFELPAQVSYSYYQLSPKEFEKEVNITSQDVEFYYSENISKYTLPEQTRARGIKLLYPKESDVTKMAAVRAKAKEAREAALSGQRFQDLVAKYSDDLPSKILEGDLGWLARGDKSEVIDKAIAATAVGAISELIETDYGFEIIKVEEKRPTRPRPLEEVRATIEQDLRSREAPAYASNRARELLTQAQKGGKTLAEVMPAGSVLKQTAGLLSQSTDPESALIGLTQNVFMLPTSERLQPALIELGEASVLVQVSEFKGPTTPAFEEVKDKVTVTVRAQESSRTAANKAQELLKAVQANPVLFTTEAQGRSAKVVGPFALSREEPSSDKFPSLTAQMRAAVLGSTGKNQVIPQVFSSTKDFTVIKIEDIKAPNLAEATTVTELAKYQTQASQELAQNMLQSIVELLKERATIDIDPTVLGNQ